MTALYSRIGGIGPIRHAGVIAGGSVLKTWLRAWLVMHMQHGRSEAIAPDSSLVGESANSPG